ncbi:MAG: nitroreductase family protein [Desulfobacterales bacterium]|nr:nitroreductase family protein [Desulfobacterales bacterium]
MWRIRPGDMMVSFDQLVRRRRSIRKYRPEMPPEAWIEEMIACASMAPSPSNSQPVRFVRIVSAPMRDALQQAMTDGLQRLLTVWEERGLSKRLKTRIKVYGRFADFMFEAPALFAVGVAPHAGFAGSLVEAGLIEKDDRSVADMDISTGLSLKGFILKAQFLGLGTCILTAPLVFVPDAGKILGLEEIQLRCFVSVGFPGEIPPAVDRKTISEIYRKI